MNLMQYMQIYPMSNCTCGHTGDGANSQHEDLMPGGHGQCKIPDCNCKRFTWASWTKPTKIALNLR